MKRRTESEIRAYIDGYNACYVKFCELLKGDAPDAVAKMEWYWIAVNGVIEKEKNHEQKDE